MSNIAVKVENLSKLYQIGKKRSSNLSESLSFSFNKLITFNKTVKKEIDFFALDDVSFEIKKGEAVGIMGKNGAGKSTLLKILSRITEPTYGKITINGRLSSLLEVGTGFHPELSGRENIFLNGTILGMKRVEIKAKFDEIVDFAGIEKFIDTPVKRYSSGMYVRLAFAVAAHLEPEILIVDEVLAVGDAEFQKKCLGKMEDVSKNQGRTVLFVSHQMAMIQKICSKGILLSRGKIVEEGEIETVIQKYLQISNESLPSLKTDIGCFDLSKAERSKISGVKLENVFTKVLIKDQNENFAEVFQCGKTIILELEYKYYKKIENPKIGIIIEDDKENRVGFVQTLINMGPIKELESSGRIICTLVEPNIAPGIYYLTIGLSVGNIQLDFIERQVLIEIIPFDYYGTGNLPPETHGKVLFNAGWQIM